VDDLLELPRPINGEKNIPKEQTLSLAIIPGESCAPPGRRGSSKENQTSDISRRPYAKKK
jgi:hypothetical protein